MNLLGTLLFLILCLPAPMAQQSAIESLRVSESPPTVARSVLDSEPPALQPTPALIIATFLKREALVREALKQHMFKRDVVLQTIGPTGEVSGQYIRNSQFLFDDKGNRIERVLHRPPSTIREMKITKEDIQDLAGAQLFGIDITETGKYRLTFSGKEMSGLREAFVIDVAPMRAPNPHRMKDRFFIGRLWVDAKSFQIIRVKGIVEPEGKQRFPRFETWREVVSGELYFPTRTEADDVLRFPEKDVHYRINVRYYEYKRFASKVTITELTDPPSLQ